MTITIKTCACFILLLLIAVSARGQEITVVRYPGQPMQSLIEILLERTGFKGDIQVHPWSRNYRMALDEENILIGPFLMTSQRESLFKWLDVTIFTSRGFLYKLKSRKDIQINSLEDAKKYTIGKANNYSLPKFLSENGFDKDLEPAVSEENNLKKLFAGRIDLAVMYEQGAEAKVKNIGHDMSELEVAYQLYSSDTYLAFSKSTADNIVSRFAAELRKLDQDGTLSQLREAAKQ